MVATITLTADLGTFQADCRELAARLEARNVAESLQPDGFSLLHECLAAGGDQLAQLELVPAAGAGERLVKVKLGPELHGLLVALRTVQSGLPILTGEAPCAD